jgi:hypothetical protein
MMLTGKDWESRIRNMYSKEIRTLMLISSNANLTTRGHIVFNAGIGTCIANKWVIQAPRRAIAYKLTREGKKALETALTSEAKEKG